MAGLLSVSWHRSSCWKIPITYNVGYFTLKRTFCIIGKHDLAIYNRPESDSRCCSRILVGSNELLKRLSWYSSHACKLCCRIRLVTASDA